MLYVRYQPLGLGGGGGETNPGGSNGDIQYNNNGVFGGDPDFTTDGAGNLNATSLAATGTLSGSNLTSLGHAIADVATASLGTVTETTSSVLTLTGWTDATVGSPTITVKQATTSQSGYLSSTDWNTFNGKQPAGAYITALTGDGTASGPGSAVFTLTTVNSNVGSFTNAAITVNAKGLITAASSGTTGNLTDAGTDGIVITGGTGAVLGTGTSIAQSVATGIQNGYLSSTDWTTFNNKQSAGNYITALTGDGTASGPGSAAFTLATVNSNVGSFTLSSITVNAKGLVTAASSATTGNLTDAGTDGITITGGTGVVLGTGTSIAQQVADTSHNGYLASADWNTFNGKQAAGSYITSLTGPITASGPGAAAVSITSQTGTGTTFVMQASPTLTTPNIGAATGTSLSVTGQLTSTVATGTAPLAVSSTTQVANLNAATAGSATTATTATNLSGGAGGSIPYQSSANTTAMLANGSAGQVLTSAGTTLAPTWTTLTPTFSGLTTDGVMYATSATAIASTAAGTTGQVLQATTSASPTWGNVAASNFGTQTANTVLAGPANGTAATPTFRALAAADMPVIAMKVNLVTSSITTSLTQLDFSSVIFDTAAGVSSNQYTVPTTGYYHYDGYVQFGSAATTAGSPTAMSVYVGGSPVETKYTYVPTMTSQSNAIASGLLFLTAGNVVTVYAQTSTTTSNDINGTFAMHFVGA